MSSVKKLPDSDWSRAMHLFCNSVQKCVIPCRNVKIIKPIKVSMTTMKAICPYTHELS